MCVVSFYKDAFTLKICFESEVILIRKTASKFEKVKSCNCRDQTKPYNEKKKLWNSNEISLKIIRIRLKLTNRCFCVNKEDSNLLSARHVDLDCTKKKKNVTWFLSTNPSLPKNLSPVWDSMQLPDADLYAGYVVFFIDVANIACIVQQIYTYPRPVYWKLLEYRLSICVCRRSTLFIFLSTWTGGEEKNKRSDT